MLYLLRSNIKPQYCCYFLQIIDGLDHPFEVKKCTVSYKHKVVQLEDRKYSQPQFEFSSICCISDLVIFVSAEKIIEPRGKILNIIKPNSSEHSFTKCASLEFY